MKREARILVSSFSDGWVVGLVVRGQSVDGVVVARSCAGACLELSRLGYMGELRYAIGPCTCGLPEPPRLPPEVEDMKSLASTAVEAARRLAHRIKEVCGGQSPGG